jgi:hypothetical protein
VKRQLLISAAAAILLGIAQWYFLAFCWAYISAYSPVAAWLASSGSLGGALPAVLWLVDLLVSILLSLPVAFVLLKLRPRKLWLFLPLVVVPGFLWLNRGVIAGPYFGQFAWSFAAAWVQKLLAVPLAVWLLRVITGGGAPDFFFKRSREKLRAA